MKNNMTRTGAQKLAKRIERYWRNKGFGQVKVEIEMMGEIIPEVEGVEPLYCVRSNLVNGMPPQ